MKLTLKNYEIEVAGENFATHNYFKLPEELCLEMVDRKDQGPRYSNASRYTFSTEYGGDNDKGIELGTARAAVQVAIKKYFKSNYNLLKITKQHSTNQPS